MLKEYILSKFSSCILDWSLEKFEHTIDLRTITSTALADILMKFYAEARPKKENEVYHKNTMINIRAAINRHIQDTQRKPLLDIVRDTDFKIANGVLDCLLKQRMRTGESKPTKHKPIIDQEDLTTIACYLKNAPNSPTILRFCLLYQISIHFVSRGLEFHHQLKIDFLFVPQGPSR